MNPTVFSYPAVAELGAPVCPFCGSEIGIAQSYSRFKLAAGATLAALFAVLTFRVDSAGAWVLGVAVTFTASWILVGFSVRPWLEARHRRYRPGPAVFIVAIALEMFLYGAYLGVAAMLLGKQRDVREVLEFFSVPLAWISRRFLITSESGILDVVGTIVGNGFFLGPLIYLCWSFVSRAFERSRPIELSISHDHKDEDE